MKKFMNFLKKHSKKLAVISVVSVAALGVGVATSWGPERPTFTIERPAGHITFNSITNNPNYGDERSFVDARDGSITGSGGFANVNEVKDGQTMTVRAYVHNNAAANLNLVAENTRVRFQLPTGQSKNMRINGFISADNATPSQVYDNTDFYGAHPFSLEYLPGSARIQTNKMDTQLPDSIVGANGTHIGYDKLDGKVPGCFEFDALVTIKVKVKMPQPKFEMSKDVAKAGGAWQQDVRVKPGETVSYRVNFRNTGATELKNVVVKDTLPQHVSYVPGSSMLYNGTNPSGLKISDNIVTSQGVNIGNYAPNANAIVVFKAKIGAESPELCKADRLRNVAFVKPEGENPKEDDANVIPECDDKPEKPIYECKALTAKRIGEKQYRFEVAVRTEGGATVNKYTFNFGDNSEEVSTTENTAEHTYAQAGEYTASVRVTFNVGNEQKDANCVVKINIPEEPCPYNPELPKDDPECKEKPPVTPEIPGEKPGEPPVTVIPETGMASVIAGIFGTSATAYGLYAFVESRRALRNMK